MTEGKDITRKYNNGEITVVWQACLCTHSTLCWKELIEVFNPGKRPWVNINGASTERIIQQVKRCPSGALSYYLTNEKDMKNSEETNLNTPMKVKVNQGGPLVITGRITVTEGDGKEVEKEGTTAFCRCGHSKNSPYCDGSHLKVGFNK